MAVLFIIFQDWRPQRCPPIGEWINKRWVHPDNGIFLNAKISEYARHDIDISSVHGIFQAKVLECVAISFSRGSSQPRGLTHVSHIAGRCFIV